MMNAAAKQIRLATDDEETRFEAMAEVSEFLARNFSNENVSARVGSERNELINKLTSNPDPYAELKERANQSALDLKPYVEELVDGGSDREERLKKALKISTIANSMEFGVSGHDFDPENFREEFQRLLEEKFEIDDSSRIISEILSSNEVLLLTDNCGEVVLDQILMKEITYSGAELFVGSKSDPVQEDVTKEMAEELGVDEFGEVLPVGKKVGIFPEEIPPETIRKLDEVDLVISKGMGNFETISEFEEKIEGRLAYLLRAKCLPVARSFSVDKGDLVMNFVDGSG